MNLSIAPMSKYHKAHTRAPKCFSVPSISQTFAHHLAPSQRPDIRLRDCNAVVFGKAVESAPECMFFGIGLAGRA
jgi:hypothetical protein